MYVCVCVCQLARLGHASLKGADREHVLQLVAAVPPVLLQVPSLPLSLSLFLSLSLSLSFSLSLFLSIYLSIYRYIYHNDIVI